MRLRNALFGLALVSSLAACGGGGSENGGAATASTISPLDPPTFQTLPAATTVPPVAGLDTGAGAPVIGGTLTSYTIIAGDYPIGIGKKLGCKWEEVAAYNEILPEDFMTKKGFPGDKLNVPETCTGTGVAPPGEVTPGVTNAPAAAPENTEAPASGDGGGYTVEAGDTVYGIASKFNVSPTALAEANGWSDGINHSIFPGDKIKLPTPG